ncbi:ParB/RepB/Spo0J family partition protein [Paraburkholderia silviterrae]|uniref:ParB/RepB/Spo0J family partition protein n=1 Tax=Paraburkholderia silviterrae TaxID=2528715 RepID=A0A4R5MAD6_9BURK|nr:ParB/RepB/Spo0J family partition protein [Paraburkholderia silviterrae]TDG23321.1 ParB/RepB/Spo0J family partition protein [Paraburkholderia silviterrae]
MSSFRDKMAAKTAELGSASERQTTERTERPAPAVAESRRSSAFKTGPGMLGALAVAQQRIQELENTSDKLMLPVSAIQPNPWQPRKIFSDEGLASLAESIREVGLVEPVVVRRSDNGYQLIAGERRLRAHVLLHEEEIRASVIDCSDQDMAVLALVENVGREDLTDYEIGQSLRRAEREFPTRTRMAEALGMSRKGLYRFLAFEKLPDFIRRDLDLNPRLLGGSAADEIVSSIKKHGAHGLKAARELWPAVVAGTLDQGKLAAAIGAQSDRGDSEQSVSERSIEKIFSGKSHAGSITKDTNSFTVKLKTGVLSDAQETQIRELISQLFNVKPG